jgi:hypothetical protein
LSIECLDNVNVKILFFCLGFCRLDAVRMKSRLDETTKKLRRQKNGGQKHMRLSGFA